MSSGGGRFARSAIFFSSLGLPRWYDGAGLAEEADPCKRALQKSRRELGRPSLPLGPLARRLARGRGTAAQGRPFDGEPASFGARRSAGNAARPANARWPRLDGRGLGRGENRRG